MSSGMAEGQEKRSAQRTLHVTCSLKAEDATRRFNGESIIELARFENLGYLSTFSSEEERICMLLQAESMAPAGRQWHRCATGFVR